MIHSKTLMETLRNSVTSSSSLQQKAVGTDEIKRYLR